MICVTCSKGLVGRQTRFCSRECKHRYAVLRYKPRPQRDTSGPNSPTWKGGHRHWAPGRYGRDKDGLSWKVQRRLAWERDDYTCQHCHTKGGHRNPDVHHKVPFRVGQSHALDNLICLCKRCHLTEEAKVQDQWGGQLVVKRSHTTRTFPKCVRCGKGCRNKDGVALCYGCRRLLRSQEGRPPRVKRQTKAPQVNSAGFRCVAVPDALFRDVGFRMRAEGATCAEIGVILGMTRQGVAYRFRLYKSKGIEVPPRCLSSR